MYPFDRIWCVAAASVCAPWLSLPLNAAIPAISAGNAHSLALHADGSVRGWGADGSGQLGLGRLLEVRTAVRAPPFDGAVQVEKGSGGHWLVLKADGTVWARGNNWRGNLGDGTFQDRDTFVQVQGLDSVTSIAAGMDHSLALRADGTVWAWGHNYWGELGTGRGPDRPRAEVVPGLSDVVAVSAFFHSIALRRDGSVFAWGGGENAACNGSGTGESGPVMTLLSGMVAISAGARQTLPLKADGTVWSCTYFATTPRQVAGLSDVVQIEAPVSVDGVVLKADGTVWAWGINSDGGLGNGESEGFRTSIPVQVSGLRDVFAISGTRALRRDGTAWGWGRNAFGQLGDGSTITRFTPVQAVNLPPIAALFDAGSNAVAIDRNGNAWIMGADAPSFAEPTPVRRAAPERIPDFGGVSAISASNHSLALTTDGAVWMWPGRSGDRAVPARVSGLSDVVAISAGYVFSLAVKADGTAWAWGNNDRGQLGDGSTEDRQTPAPVAGLANVVGISAGQGFTWLGGTYVHSLAVTADGGVWAWGDNDAGQLGDGTKIFRRTPIRVVGLTDAIAVAAGGTQSFALRRDGTVWRWGNDQLTPVPVTGLSGIVAISAGQRHQVALASDGTVWAWGDNFWGSVGDGTTQYRDSPVRIRGLDGVSAVSAGHGFTLALKADGTVWSWGGNYYGNLGDGTFVNRALPTVVLRESGLGSIVGNDWFLDLQPVVGSAVSAEATPVFLTTALDRGSAGTRLSIDANVQFRAQDIGTSASLFVFALAPRTLVLTPAVDSSIFPRMGAKSGGKDTPVECVLAQLNAAGQLVGVSAANIQAYVTGVLSSRGQTVTILNGVPTVNLGGATFFVGFGPNASRMLSGGTNRGVVTVAGDVECRPESPQTGWWWNPTEDGRGFSIEKRGSNLFFAAFLYDVTGRSTWHVSSGPVSLDGSMYVGELLSAHGGQTLGGAYSGFPTISAVGPLSLAFNTATTGTMVWPGGAIPIQRFDIIPGGASAVPAENLPEAGWWWNENEPGRGFFLEWQGSTLDMAGYMYDEAGNPVWYITVGTQSADGRSFSGNWWSYGGGMTLMGPWRPHQRVSANVAPVTVTFSTPDTAFMTLPNGRTTSLRRHRF